MVDHSWITQFPETDSYERSPRDVEAASFEFRRAVAEPAGHAGTLH